jgi:PAS domain S-box-containing protein
VKTADSPASGAAAFRQRLRIALMVVVGSITVITLTIAQRRVQDDAQRTLQNEFQSRLGYLLGVQETRRTAIAERCSALARSVRIRAALEENDIEHLYGIAEIELRDVISNSKAGPHFLRANFFRFLNASGEVMFPSEGPGSPPQPWERYLALKGAPTAQEVGYFGLSQSDGSVAMQEIVATPIVTTDTGEVSGALVLGVDAVALDGQGGSRELKTGLWLSGQLQMPGLDPSERARLSRDVADAAATPGASARSFTVQANGAPHLLFLQEVNAGSRYPSAYQICLYPLADSLAQQARIRWQILGAGTLLLVGGLLASHWIARRFSAPVEQLAKDSADHFAGKARAEAALVLTEEKYRSIFENAVEGIFLLAPDGRFLSVNPALSRVFGYNSPAQLLAQLAAPIHTLYADSQQLDDALRLAGEGEIVVNFEAEMRRQDGRKLWIAHHIRAVRDEGGALRHFEGTLEDITERKRNADKLRVVNTELEKALADLKATQQQIIQQERLRALGQMASGIAHDFNNALVPILGFCELLQHKPALLNDRVTAMQYLDIIQTAATDASSVVGRLREFYRSKDDREGFASVDPEKLVQQAMTLTKPKWKDQAQASGATITVVPKLEKIPPIAGDESALREVLTNLIFNAVDAMPSGGTLTLRTYRLGESAVIEVADTGTGMSAEVRQRCLEPFFSTKGDRGTGLGLSMVFGIIQRHSGLLDIRSEPSQGTTFVITLPLYQAAIAGPAQTAAETPSRPLHLLVVEDEAQVRQLLHATLTAEGHTVELASHGVEGLKRFLDGRFDLVLTDKAMPGMSGDQLATSIKQIDRRMPIILLTGFGQFLNPEEYPDVDVVAAKPISIAALRDAISTALKAA